MKSSEVVTLPFNDEIVEKTIDNAIKKLHYTMSNLMYNRPPVEIYDNIVMGDIAKNSILYYLRSKCIREIIDYDEIRDDAFTKPDPGWDFMFGTTNIKVEVKSSIPPNGESVESIINLRDIKITASNDNGKTFIPVESLISDVHIQVYFYAKTYKLGYNSLKELYDSIHNDRVRAKSIINIDKYAKPMFFGWDTKNNIIGYSKVLQPKTWTFSWTDRIYWRCPIMKAKGVEELICLINETI